jgi:hypothetical protein
MHPEQKRTFQAMTPEQKLQLALDLYYSAKKLKAAGLQKKLKAAGLQNQHPDWAVDTIRQKVRDIFLYART